MSRPPASARPSVATARRRGFTMLELLIVVVVLGLLMTLLFPVLHMLQRQRKKVETKQLMDNISTALNLYLETYPVLGDDGASGPPDATSSKFVDSPLTYLVRNPKLAGNEPYLKLARKFLAVGPAAGPWSPGTEQNADQVCDAFTMSDHSNHLHWCIVNAKGSGSATYNYTDVIWMRSAVDTPENPKDDLISRFTLKNGQWLSMNYAEAVADSSPPPATFWQP